MIIDLTNISNKYIDEVRRQLKSNQAREHAYRPALVGLMESFEDVGATNDPKRSEHGNPDMIFYKQSNHDIILGYAETKDITANLDKVIETEQLKRYAGYNKLILTNYLEFRFYQHGVEYKQIVVGHLSGDDLFINNNSMNELARELEAFIELPPVPIKSATNLALIMGQKGRRIRDNISRYLNEDLGDNKELERIYELMKKLLVHDLSKDKFSDMYAQTLVYGLFASRYSYSMKQKFTRRVASESVPASNPFLREFFAHIGGIHFDKRLAYIVDELCEVYSITDVHKLLHTQLNELDREYGRDPVIHFYEDFLKEYDPEERKKMGAYYTPVPVVRFIIGEVDSILKNAFGLEDGITDISKITKDIETGQDLRYDRRKKAETKIRKYFHRVQILDPAVGTATFLNEAILFIRKNFEGQEGRWKAYVKEDLVPRLSGFEIMMAPSTIAHLKLEMTLQELGIHDLKQRIGVYLTNTLEEGIPQQLDLFSSLGLAGAVTEESQAASGVKHDVPIMIVMGNPPYSSVSSNETKFANNLIAKYKVEPGGLLKLNERKHWLNDDYVKFIAFSEEMIVKNGEGVMAMITNNGYISNPTFRGMRWHLCQTFDEIKILDLHGNTRRKEIAPDGGKDENIFNIQQGVAIIVAYKLNKNQNDSLAKVFRADLYGSRKSKFQTLLKSSIKWDEITLDKSTFEFIEKSTENVEDYKEGINLNNLFIQKVSGVVTMGDSFIVNEDKNTVAERVKDLSEGKYSEQELNSEFKLGKNYAKFVLTNSSHLTFDEDKIVKITYRPFDTRWTYFDKKVLWRWRENVMKNFIDHENIGLCYERGGLSEKNPFFVTKNIIPNGLSFSNTASIVYVAPIYQYHDDASKSSNLNLAELKKFSNKLTFEPDPEDILSYIYAVLYSPKYKSKYQSLLRSGFPIIPIPNDDKHFKNIAAIGVELQKLHTMQQPSLSVSSVTFPESGTNIIDIISFKQVNEATGDVFINTNQYFGNISITAWDLYISGYQPAQKWLKDRKGKYLSNEDIVHYEKIIACLEDTDRLMKVLNEIVL
ncbi:MAG: type ISP restriction/modification enzyme [Candidatus Saccharimonadales bacterium]